MVNRRGGLLPSPVPKGWGAGVASWWISLQPSERGKADAVHQLSPCSPTMDWKAISTTGGYKGPFLLVWCMMHWANLGHDIGLWKGVADDMATAFKAISKSRGSVDTASGEAGVRKGGPSGTKRQGKASAGADGRSKRAQTGGKKVTPPAVDMRLS